MENAGIAQLKLLRSGGDLSNRILVKFSTRDKSALRGRHYIHEEGTPIRICFNGMVSLLKVSHSSILYSLHKLVENIVDIDPNK